MSIMAQLFPGYVRNWRKLRQVVNEVGAECEQWTYAELDRPAEQQPLVERTIAGRQVSFTIDCWDKRPNGDLIISIDAHGLPTLAGVKPAYQFAKRVDGSVYYP
jgi:hypothetical protein